ncbi:MAG: site-specific integrase [Planctomycetes bacterium]|nr:site-specific integrase [Planctomycetota bacterium]
MSLFKRGNVWWAYFYIDGVRHQESTGTSNKHLAENIEHKLRTEASARRHQLVEYDLDLTVAALAARFLADGEVRPHHIWHLKALLPFFGDTLVVRLNRNMAREFRLWRKKQDVTDATVNRALSVLRHILFWALDETLIETNPMARVPLVQERRIKRPVMTLDEEALLLPALLDYLRGIVTAALDTGMRRGEVLKQRWEDVDLSRKLLLVSSSKTAGGESREIPLTKRVQGLLEANSRPEGVVFTLNGKPLSWIRKGYLGGIKRAGLRHFRFHDLRHTFNTRLMEAGVIADVRMALMGHSGGSNVHSIYTHVELPAKRKAIGQLEAWVNQQQEELKKDKEQKNASTKERSESSVPGEIRGTQAVEEEDAR